MSIKDNSISVYKVIILIINDILNLLNQFQKMNIYNKWIVKQLLPTTAIRTYLFSSDQSITEVEKRQILKTYLQVIPPKKIYQLVQKQSTSNVINQFLQNQAITEKHLKKELKKIINLTTLPTLTKLTQTIVTKPKENNQYKSILNIIFTHIRKKAQTYEVQQLVNFIYILAKNNVKNVELMRDVQSVIIQERIKINYHLIRKILYSYTFLDVGTATLYSHVCKSIKVGQFQLQPLQISEFSYMLSKVSDNAQGGYGTFLIAEKHLMVSLPRMDFRQLVQAAFNMLSQNIGTNAFQTELQKHLYQKYPASDLLNIKDLVNLLKATSGYYFKFKDAALLYMLRASTLRQARNATLQQFEDIIWSWGRSGKADFQLCEILQKQTLRRVEQLKPRQIAFFYYSLSSYKQISQELFVQLQNKFMQLNLQEINQHYLLKFLLGMNKRADFPMTIFSQISKILVEKVPILSGKQLVTFIRVLNESDLDFQNKANFQQLQDSIKSISQRLKNRLYTLRVGEIVELAYLLTKLDIKSMISVEQLLKKVQMNIKQVPKSVFIKAMFCFVMKDQYMPVYQMIGILSNLQNYGKLGYFFSPYEFPLLGYCVFHMKVKVKSNIKVNEDVLSDIRQTMKQVQPEILNNFIRKGYEEAMNLIEKSENSRK